MSKFYTSSGICKLNSLYSFTGNGTSLFDDGNPATLVNYELTIEMRSARPKSTCRYLIKMWLENLDR